jgi:hypothetical protein
MLRLIHAEEGRAGVLRHYQHDRLGMLVIVTVWGKPGADVIHLQTYKLRAATPDDGPSASNGKPKARHRKGAAA